MVSYTPVAHNTTNLLASVRLADLNSCFGNGNGLLFHGFVNSHLVFDIHLVKLINAADAVVCQHERTCLNAELTAVWLLRLAPHYVKGAQTRDACCSCVSFEAEHQHAWVGFNSCVS